MKASRVLRFVALAFSLMFALRVSAQATSFQVTNLPAGQTLSMVLYMGPKGTTPPVTTPVSSTGPISSLQGLLGSSKAHIQMKSWYCKDANGNIILISLPATEPNPCPGGKELAGAWWLDNPNTVVFDIGNETVSQAPYKPAHGGDGGGGATTGGLPVSLQVTLSPGATLQGGYSEECRGTLPTGATCTSNYKAFKFDITGDILFGSGKFKGGFRTGVVYRQSPSSTYNCPATTEGCEGPFTEIGKLRFNSVPIDAVAVFDLGSHAQFSVFGGETVNFLTERYLDTSGSGTSSSSSTYSDSYVLGSPNVGASLTWFLSNWIGVGVTYDYTAIRFEKYLSPTSSESYSDAVHDNDVAATVVLRFRGHK